jgi:hypothetical protein
VLGEHCLLAEGDIGTPIYWRTDAPSATTIGAPIDPAPIVLALCRFRFSLVNLRQRVAKIYFPPPLDVTPRTQRSQNSGEQQSMNRASSSWWFIVSRNQESTRLLWTGSGEPAARRAKQHYITCYIHTMIIMQLTGLLNISFASLLICFVFFAGGGGGRRENACVVFWSTSSLRKNHKAVTLESYPHLFWVIAIINTLVIRSSLKDWESMKKECILARHKRAWGGGHEREISNAGR